MADHDKRRTTTRRRGDLKDIDDKKVSGTFWQLPSGPRSKRKAAAEPHALGESESTNVISDNSNAPAVPVPAHAEVAVAAPAVPHPVNPEEDEISLKPSAVVKREGANNVAPQSASAVPTLASLAEKEIAKGEIMGRVPPPPPPPPGSAKDKAFDDDGQANGGKKLKRSRGKDFPEPAPSLPVGKQWMTEREVLGPLMYHCGEPLGDLDDSIGKTLQIYCPARFLSHRNPEVIARNVWGSHPAGYTDDSDVVAMLLHSSLVHAGDVGPTDIAGVIAYIKVLPGLATYPSAWDQTHKYMKSRKWPSPHPVALRVERVELLERDHLLRTTYTLPQRDVLPVFSASVLSSRHLCLRLSSPPTAVTPRRGAPYPDSDQSSEPEIALKGKQDHDNHDEDEDNANEVMTLLRKKEHHGRQRKQDRVLGDIVVMCNFSNEVCKKYTLAAVMDKGLEQQQWTAFRLKNQALYFESPDTRYELSRIPPTKECAFDRYRWARVLSPLKSDLVSWPLPADYVQVLEDKLDWNEIQWGPTGCDVRGKSYAFKKVFWRNYRMVTPPPPPVEAPKRKKAEKSPASPANNSNKAASALNSSDPKEQQDAKGAKDGEKETDSHVAGSTTLHLRRMPKKKKGKE